MYFHLILTDDCNLCCSYCRAKTFEGSDDAAICTGPQIEIDPDLPVELDFDLNLLYDFLKLDPLATLTFYGGEPLLKADLIGKIIRDAPVHRFMIQTNGILLDRLDPATVNRFSTILVSLDGNETLTDAHRGSGVYRNVMDNIRKIVSNGYSGELIGRMTVTEQTDIVQSVRYLDQNPDHSFTSVHCQNTRVTVG
jgi:uncharacterized protein